MKISSLTDLPETAAYLARIGAEPRSLRTAVIREVHGDYWTDRTIVRFAKDGTVAVDDMYAPTDSETAAIAREFLTAEWPQIKPIDRLPNKLPKALADVPPEHLYEFRGLDGKIIMVQVRTEAKKGTKAYLPWTYWDDDEWRCAEPEGPLPLYNADRLADAATVFIHEGAKAARHMQRLVDGKTRADRDEFKAHPWHDELDRAVHIGWIGGALSPVRTDWSVLKKAGIKRAYIVADNDSPGLRAIPAISQQLNIPTFSIEFNDRFPASFDLADPFPESFWGTADGGRYYIGPAFAACLHPATWATDLIPNPAGRGRPVVVLRESFREMWAYVESADLFVCKEIPNILRTERIFNMMTAAFSHTFETGKLLAKSYKGRIVALCYRPDRSELVIDNSNFASVNLHGPGVIRPAPGDPKPFLDFMDFLFPSPDERHEVLRWCATLIARPDVRIGYGLLLVSETQGVGKTTLAEQILAPLVGKHNCSFPGEGMIVNPNFNSWLAQKRLVVVNEIYSGSSWKAYHTLKSAITDNDVTVNEKYQREYMVENWAHIVAMSNSMRCLKMEQSDRRWFFPEVVEFCWPAERYTALREWLNQGGRAIIAQWALDWDDYVASSDRAPLSERKREMIEGSQSEALREATALAEALCDEGDKAVVIKDVVTWLRTQVQGTIYDTDYEIRRAMRECGAVTWRGRIKIHGRMQYAIMPHGLEAQIRQLPKDEQADAIRKSVVTPTQLIETDM